MGGKTHVTQSIDLQLAKRLYFRRKELCLTQRRVGELAGVTFQQVQKYECGANRITAAMLWLLADALEVPITYFYDGLSKPQNGADAQEALLDAA
ncbi:MAG: helix-turn-helix transcriptional regulator [Patescibacteria group bacterium]